MFPLCAHWTSQLLRTIWYSFFHDTCHPHLSKHNTTQENPTICFHPWLNISIVTCFPQIKCNKHVYRKFTKCKLLFTSKQLVTGSQIRSCGPYYNWIHVESINRFDPDTVLLFRIAPSCGNLWNLGLSTVFFTDEIVKLIILLKAANVLKINRLLSHIRQGFFFSFVLKG